MTALQINPRVLTAAIRNADLIPRVGRVTSYQGLSIASDGPDAFVGELCEIYGAPGHRPVMAEVVGFNGRSTLLLPHGDVHGVRAGAEVLATGHLPHVPTGAELLGRVIDAGGNPLDGKGKLNASRVAPLKAAAPNPVERNRIDTLFETGVKVIDVCTPLGVGQRVGVFSGSGVGKSTLMGMIARNGSADVNVIALIGERGREVRDFIEENLKDALSRSVVIVATADQPALLRRQAALAAMSIAEHFRDEGRSVLLLMDSLTRLAMAQREIGLAAGEPPTARGYTPSVFSLMPTLLERAGRGAAGQGSITGIFTVLVEGDDLNEPITDHARAILDGHIVLSRDLSQKGQFPPVDALGSVSRLARSLCTAEEMHVVEQAVAIMALYQESKDMIDFGAYKPGSNAQLDRAVALAPKIALFLRQRVVDRFDRKLALAELRKLLESVK